MYKANQRGKIYDPYILDFPITVNTEGQIKVTATVEDFGASNVQGYWLITLVGHYADRTRVLRQKKRSSPGQLILLYGVGSPQLRQVKKYVVHLINEMNIPVRGTMTISYPSKAGGQGQQISTGSCDLAINKISLSGDCKVVVEVVNNGSVNVPHQVWTSQAGASLYLFRNGKSWGGASLKDYRSPKKSSKTGWQGNL